MTKLAWTFGAFALLVATMAIMLAIGIIVGIMVRVILAAGLVALIVWSIRDILKEKHWG